MNNAAIAEDNWKTTDNQAEDFAEFDAKREKFIDGEVADLKEYGYCMNVDSDMVEAFQEIRFDLLTDLERQVFNRVFHNIYQTVPGLQKAIEGGMEKSVGNSV